MRAGRVAQHVQAQPGELPEPRHAEVGHRRAQNSDLRFEQVRRAPHGVPIDGSTASPRSNFARARVVGGLV